MKKTQKDHTQNNEENVISKHSVQTELALFATTSDLVSMLGQMIDHQIQLNQNIQNTLKTRYSSDNSPAITITAYLKRFAQYSEANDSTYIIMLIYLNRYFEHHRRDTLHLLNAHRLVLTSFLVAYKFNEDDCFDNEFMSLLGSIPRRELNVLELDFCTTLRFSFYVNVKTYQDYYQHILNNNVSLRSDTQEVNQEAAQTIQANQACIKIQRFFKQHQTNKRNALHHTVDSCSPAAAP